MRAEASLPLGVTEPSPDQFLDTPRLLKSSQLPEGLGLIPNPHTEPERPQHPATVAPVPQCLVSVASRPRAVWDMNHLLPRPAAARCLRESQAPGRILPPHLSCACYLCPTAASGQHQRPLGSSRGQNRFPSRCRLQSPEGICCLSGSLAALQASGRAPCRRGKPGREEPCSFWGTEGWEGSPESTPVPASLAEGAGVTPPSPQSDWTRVCPCPRALPHTLGR